MNDEYKALIERKRKVHSATGIDLPTSAISPRLFDWQKDVVRWALRKGRACLFQDCGMGKTIQQLEWARLVPGDVLVVTPLAVASQTAAEGARFGIEAAVSRDGTKAGKITITNYGMLHRFNPADFTGLVLDESSILKSLDGATRQTILDMAAVIPFRLACTATPAPNDHMELGGHAEFVGASTTTEMLATFFVHDGGDTSKWRLKGHAKGSFWDWVATWAVMLRSPADLGYECSGYDLPPLKIHETVLNSGIIGEGELFAAPAATLGDLRVARRTTMGDRVGSVAEMVNGSADQWIVWCELNAEGDALLASIPDAVQVSGSDSDDAKVAKIDRFTSGAARVLITKPKIAGFGMNWQHVSRMAFVGLSHSWEQFYQAVRRCWRFGQKSHVDVHIVTTDKEIAVLESIKRKQADADTMATGMVEAMSATSIAEIRNADAVSQATSTGVVRGDGWTMFHGDCVQSIASVPTDSVGYTVFSPPFASLYTYTANDHDMGNCRSDDEFFEQFDFLVGELLRVTVPGRLLSFHCMQLPSTKLRDGVIGLRDFRGDLIRAFTKHGWVYHSEVVIWKNPVTQMQRTKALGLLHKTIRTDSSMSRQGLADYLVTMRKPGKNPDPVTHGPDLPVELWQQYASPVWMDIDEGNTLQHRSAREHDDERHICPLQLGVIERAIHLWSKPGDTVLSPFAGIGSEGHCALSMGRKFIGMELKDSYFKQAVANLRIIGQQMSIL